MLVLPSRASPTKKVLKYCGLGVIFAGSAVIFVMVGYMQHAVAPFSPIPSILHAQAVSVGVPARLIIPAIQVDTAITTVGLTSDGAMDVKPGLAQAAWYEPGPRPGDNGSAVLAGHYGPYNGKPSLFDNLSVLKLGDEIQVQDAAGVLVTFVIRETKRYDPEADTAAIFSSRDGKAHLNLITCDGTWDAAKKTYSNRLVVFADRKL